MPKALDDYRQAHAERERIAKALRWAERNGSEDRNSLIADLRAADNRVARIYHQLPTAAEQTEAARITD